MILVRCIYRNNYPLLNQDQLSRVSFYIQAIALRLIKNIMASLSSTEIQIINGITFVQGTELSTLLINQIFHHSLFSQRDRNLSFKRNIINSSQHFRFITKLTLINDHIQNGGIEYIAQAGWKFITDFEVHSNLTKQGIAYLSKCNWKFMKSVNLSNNQFKNAGLKELIKCDWPQLQFLRLDNTGITENGVKILAKNRWHHLKNIDISYNQLGNEALKYLLRSNWPQLCLLFFKQPGGYNEFLMNSMYIWQNYYSKLLRLDAVVLSGCELIGLQSEYARKILQRKSLNKNQPSFQSHEELSQSGGLETSQTSLETM